MTPSWNPREYQDRHAYVFKFGEDLLGLLAAQPGERILDLGCGTGQLSAAIAEAGARVTGLDLSREMLEEARAHYPHIEFVEGNAADFTLAEPVDAIFSNAALHWVKNAEGVAASVERALRPNGRFVAELGGRGNIRTILAAFRAEIGDEAKFPWFYPSIGEYASILERHGMEVRQAWLFDRPTRVEAEDGMEHWLGVFTRGVVAGMDAARANAVFKAVAERLRDRFYADGAWTLDYRRLRIVAVKTG